MALWQFEIRTALTPAQVSETLSALTLPASQWLHVRAGFPFRGTVGRAQFALREVSQWRHFYNPRLLGQVSTRAGHTYVLVRLRPSVGAWVAHAVMTLVAYLRTDLLGALLAAIGLFIVVWVFTLALSLTGKRLLADALHAQATT